MATNAPLPLSNIMDSSENCTFPPMYYYCNMDVHHDGIRDNILLYWWTYATSWQNFVCKMPFNDFWWLSTSFKTTLHRIFPNMVGIKTTFRLFTKFKESVHLWLLFSAPKKRGTNSLTKLWLEMRHGSALWILRLKTVQAMDVHISLANRRKLDTAESKKWRLHIVGSQRSFHNEICDSNTWNHSKSTCLLSNSI